MLHTLLLLAPAAVITPATQAIEGRPKAPNVHGRIRSNPAVLLLLAVLQRLARCTCSPLLHISCPRAAMHEPIFMPMRPCMDMFMALPLHQQHPKALPVLSCGPVQQPTGQLQRRVRHCMCSIMLLHMQGQQLPR